jgi:hypothetical protein
LKPARSATPARRCQPEEYTHRYQENASLGQRHSTFSEDNPSGEQH